MDFNEAFVSVKELVNDFRENERAFIKADYSEANVRRDFINKFLWIYLRDRETLGYKF